MIEWLCLILILMIVIFMKFSIKVVYDKFNDVLEKKKFDSF